MAGDPSQQSSPPHGGDAPQLLGWHVQSFCWKNNWGEWLVDWHLHILMPVGGVRTAIFSQPCPHGYHDEVDIHYGSA